MFNWLIALPFGVVAFLLCTLFGFSIFASMPISALVAYSATYTARIRHAEDSPKSVVLTLTTAFGIPLLLSVLAYYAFTFYLLTHAFDTQNASWYAKFIAIGFYFIVFFYKCESMPGVHSIEEAVKRTAQMLSAFIGVLISIAVIEWMLGSNRDSALLFAGIGGFFTWIFLQSLFEWVNAEPPERGGKLVDFAKAVNASIQKTRHDDLKIFWAGLWLPSNATTRNFAVVGTTGSGKTKILQLFLQSTLPHIGKGLDHRMLMYDPKLDAIPFLLTMKAKGIIRKDVRICTLNPFESRPEFARAIDMPSFVGRDDDTARQLAKMFIPDRQHESENSSHFTKAARLVLSGIIISLSRTVEDWDFRDLVLACLSESEDIVEILERTDESAWMAKEYFDDRDSGKDVLQTLRTEMGEFQGIAAGWHHVPKKHRIDLSEWLRSEYILILGHDEERKTSIQLLNRIIILRLGLLINAQEKSETRRTLLVFDEVREAGHLDLTTIFTKGRERGAAVAIGFQDKSGLNDAYSNNQNRVDEMLGQTKYKLIYHLETSATAEWAEKEVGYRYEKKKEKSTNPQGEVSTSEKTERVPVVMATEFMDSEYLPLASREAGLTGICRTPDYGIVKAHLSGDYVQKNFIEEDKSIEGVTYRSPEELRIGKWSPEDRERLGFTVRRQMPEAKRGDADTVRTEQQNRAVAAGVASQPEPETEREKRRREMREERERRQSF